MTITDTRPARRHTKRLLTEVEKAEGLALRQAITQYNESRPLEQRIGHYQAAESIGITGPAFSHYLAGRNAINLKFAMEIERVYGIAAAVYSPRLAAKIAEVEGGAAELAASPGLVHAWDRLNRQAASLVNLPPEKLPAAVAKLESARRVFAVHFKKAIS